jgi:phosphocarrier protein FPr
MVLRTLDVGGDKPLPYVPMDDEANPFLGVRGLRLGLARPELLRTQLRAAYRVAADHDLRVMFPMVTTIEELRAARALADEVRVELGVAKDVPLGIMIEVPAAAMLSRTLAREAAFFSIGTNDLTQYVLAAERGNAGVASLADGLHPAVLRAIAATVDGASAEGRPVAVCGELASDLPAVPILLGLGVAELSVAPPAVPRVKQAVRGTSMSEARELAARALEASSAPEVRSLVPA